MYYKASKLNLMNNPIRHFIGEQHLPESQRMTYARVCSVARVWRSGNCKTPPGTTSRCSLVSSDYPSRPGLGFLSPLWREILLRSGKMVSEEAAAFRCQPLLELNKEILLGVPFARLEWPSEVGLRFPLKLAGLHAVMSEAARRTRDCIVQAFDQYLAGPLELRDSMTKS